MSHQFTLLILLMLSGPGPGPPPAAPPLPLLAEGFDSVGAPALPTGWLTSSARSVTGDFVTTLSGAHSPPGCALSSNATIEQSLTSPPIDPGGRRDCAVSWMERRSSTHDATLFLEASTDGGASFAPIPDGAFPPPGGTAFVARTAAIPDRLWDTPPLILRWRIAGDGTGATGTLRLDDLALRGRLALDLGLGPIVASPPHAGAGEDVRCDGVIRCEGYEGVGGAVVRWGVQPAPSGPGDPAVAEGSVATGPMAPGDSAAFTFSFTRPGAGPLTITAAVGAAEGGADQDPRNDTATAALPAVAARGTVIITEILYDPAPGRDEYVELFNRSSAPVDLAGWRLGDREEDTAAGRLAGNPLTLGPGGYLVCSPGNDLRSQYPQIPGGALVVEGHRGFTLNNGGDRLFLSDASGVTVDLVEYSPGWHTPTPEPTQGRSLERILPGATDDGAWNWGTSAAPAGGTPGAPNSLSVDGSRGGGRLSCSPNPFSPDGDGFEDVTEIRYAFGGRAVIARVRIFDARGRAVRTLTAGTYGTAEGAIAWNGYDDRGRAAGTGAYIVLVDALDPFGSAVSAERTVVVVARGF